MAERTITETLHGQVVLRLPTEGPLLATSAHALDLVGEAWGTGAEVVVVPVSRFEPSFFDLSTGQAGEFLQRLVNYRLHLVILGDLAAPLAVSRALRDFVRESNRGRHVWFCTTEQELTSRLASL